MKLEQQVCSLESAQKLKELGVKQESLYHWLNGVLVNKQEREQARFDNNAHNTKNNFYSAFTVAELGEFVQGRWATINRDGKQWECTDILVGVHTETAITEAEARAKMLIYLLENNLLPKA